MSNSDVSHLRPSDWSREPLGDLLTRPPSYGINAAAASYSPEAPTYIRITDINAEGHFAPNPKVSVRHPLADSYRLEDGDLVFARTGATVGKSYRYLPVDGDLVFAGFLIRVTPDPTRLDPGFLGYYVQSKPYWNWVRVMSVRSGQPGINGVEYAQLPIDLPPLDEQKAIAAELARVDELIASLEQLISKKRKIKHGMQQQLLSGAKRLPSFTDAWQECKLRDVLDVRHGKSQKEVEVPNGRYPILATGGEIGRTDTPLYSKPSVLIGRKGTIDSPQYRDRPFWSVDTLFYTDVHSAEVKYIFYVFQTIDWRSLNEASGVPSLSASRIEGLPVLVPGPDEQKAIAGVLSDMDAEIEALEARLEKTRDIKRGMMQELLSGQTRLAPEAVAA